MVTDAETHAFQQGTSGLKRILPVLRRNGFHETCDRFEVMLLKMKEVFPLCRDIELLNDTGCCCGEIRGKRNNRQLCEACIQRCGNGGNL